jgi:hypothetical protein
LKIEETGRRKAAFSFWHERRSASRVAARRIRKTISSPFGAQRPRGGRMEV